MTMKKPTTLDRINKPAHGKPIFLEVNEPEMLQLDNGLKIYLIRAGNEEVTRIDISVNAGTAFQNKKLVANSTGKLLLEGTLKSSSSFIAEKLDFFGTYLSVNINADNAVLSMYSLTKHLDEMLPLLGELLTMPAFFESELLIHLDRKKQEFLVNSEKVKYVAMNEFTKMVFGEDSAYGQILNEKDFEQVKRNDLIDFFTKYYIPERAYIVISGKIEENVLSLVNRFIGNGWAANENVNKKKEILFTSAVSEKNRFIHRPGSLQSAIRVGQRIINKMHPDYDRFILINTIFGGYFGSRLMSNLREDKGFTYGVSSYVLNYKHGSFFSVSTEVNSKHTEEAMQEIVNEMELMRNEKVSEKELSLVKNYIYGTFLRNFDGPFALADRFLAVKDFGLDFAYYKNSLNAIMQVDADQLIETARIYLNPEDMIQLVVGSYGS
jgi:predicted Zn-dependent peptidase